MKNDKIKSGEYYRGNNIDWDVYFAQFAIWITIGLVVKTFSLIIQFGNMDLFEELGAAILKPFKAHNFQKQIFILVVMPSF